MAKKIGIIGAGGMLQYHAAGFKAAGGQLHAICDMNQEAARKRREHLRRAQRIRGFAKNARGIAGS